MNDYNEFMANIEACDKHIARMKAAMMHSKQLFPMKVEVLERLSDIDLFSLETLITRFAKLQDTIGQKLFPMILKLFLNEDPHGKSFIDILNTMEKIGALESRAIWEKFRDIRSSITHEYPGQSSTCDQLNLCMITSHDLIAYWQFLRKFIEDKILVHYKIEA